jgi:hypothetical protein
MPTPKPEHHHKKPNVNANEIAEFLERTGFVLEMRVNELLLDSGYKTVISPDFYDLDGSVDREIDIIATKKIKEIDLHLIIECKQSATDKWIFLANKRLPLRIATVKHLPKVSTELIHEGLLDHLHFDGLAPLCHNYLVYTIDTKKQNKETSHYQIDECIHKLPKALVDRAAWQDEGRHLFIPVALFSGQMFVIKYKGKLNVEETSFLRYYARFVSKVYVKPTSSADEGGDFTIYPRADRASFIREAKGKLGSIYQIHFVTEAGLPDYLKQVENAISKVDITKWEPMPPSDIPF